MPHISKKRLQKKTFKRINDELLVVFEKAQGKNNLLPLFKELITKTEKIMLSKRLAIIIMLSKEIPQHRIVTALGVSPSTVAKMSLNLETGKYNSIIKLSNRKDFKLLDFIEFILTGGGTVPPKYGRGRWKWLFKDFHP